MTREQLFRKYSIVEAHNYWDDSIDNWNSVEIYRIMHNGNLPSNGDMSIDWVTDFLDKTEDMKFMSELMMRKDWGSLYLTAKRMIYSLWVQILNTKNI